MDHGIFTTSLGPIEPEQHTDPGYKEEDYADDQVYNAIDNDMESDKESRLTEDTDTPIIYQQTDHFGTGLDPSTISIPDDQRSIGIDYDDLPPIYQQTNDLDPDVNFNESAHDANAAAGRGSDEVNFTDIPETYQEEDSSHRSSENNDKQSSIENNSSDVKVDGVSVKQIETNGGSVVCEENKPGDLLPDDRRFDNTAAVIDTPESPESDEISLHDNPTYTSITEEQQRNNPGGDLGSGAISVAETSGTSTADGAGDPQNGFKYDAIGSGMSDISYGTALKSKDEAIYELTDDSLTDTKSVKKYRADMKKCVLCGLAVFLALVIVGVAAFCIIYFLGPSAGMVKTPVGQIKGKVVETHQGLEVEEYLGIPFAEKPIGQLRYSDPVPLAKLPQDPYNADSHQFTCLGYIDTTFGDFAGSSMWNAPNPLSEDCLYLNVWVPRQRDQLSKTPVMVWIYGGGFFSGSNALDVYDGKALAAYTGMIVVSFNYRVGTFGYLSTGGDNKIKGNFGMKDQVLALRWVQDNIASFGGDPDLVTIFGESSGASSAGLHMMSDHSKDLFKRAIFESGSPDSHWSFMTEAQAEERSQKFFAAVGCTQEDTDELMACLRALDASTILEQEWVDFRFMVFPWAPCVDGDFLVDTPYNLLHQGKFQKKDSLLGVNRDEGTYWILYALPGFSKDGPSLQNYTMFREGVDIIDWDLSEQTREEIKTLYSPVERSNLHANRDSLDKVCGDRSFTCPTKELTRLYTDAGIKTYFYYLTYRSTTEVWPPWMGVIHGAEIQWVFGVPMDESKGYTAEEVEFSKAIMSYWSNFAKTGDPNGEGLPIWPQFTPNDREVIEFRNVPQDFFVRTELRDGYCEKWMEINDKINLNQTV